MDKPKKHSGGRPSKFFELDLKQVKILIQRGFTNQQIAEFFNISVDSLSEWQKRYPKFSAALKGWKKEADEKVERCLYERATGFEYDEIVYEKSKTGGLSIGIKDEEIEDIKHSDCYKTKIIVKKVVPDVTAQIFWLKNRQPERWRDRQEIDHSGKVEGQNIVIQIVKPATSD